MPSLDLEVRTQLNLAMAEAAANEALRIFSRTGDEIASGFGGRITRALGGLKTSAAQSELRGLQSEYAKLAAAEKAAADMSVRRASEVEVALRRKVAVQASDTATTLEAARAERALVDARRANEQALRRHESAMVNTAAAQQRLGDSAVAAGTAAETAGRAWNVLGVGAVAATGIAMAETTHRAGDFQEAMIKLNASAGETGQMLGGQFTGNLKVVSDGILQMAGNVGYSAGQLTEAMYTVEKAGFRGSDGLKVLQAAAQGAGAEQADLKEVVDGLTTSMTDFHVAPDQAARLMSQMVTAVGAAKTNFQDFAGALHSVEPVAAAAHLRLEDVWGSLAQITQSGTSAEQATENMRNAINAFTGQSQPARDAMAQFGINADEVSQKLSQRGLAGTMQYLYGVISQKVIPGSNLLDQGELLKNAQAVGDLDAMVTQMSPHAQELATQFKNNEIGVKAFTKEARAMGGEDAAKLLQFEQLNLKVDGFSKATKTGRDNLETLAAAMRAVTGTVAGQSVALQLSGENTERVNQTIKDIAGTYTDAQGNVKGFAESQEGLNAKMRDVKASFGAAAIEIGETFVPLMTEVANIGKDVADTFARHPAVMHAVVDGVGAMAGAWAIFKAANIAETVLAPVARGLGSIIDGEAGAEAGASRLSGALGRLARAGALAAGAQIVGNAAQDAAGSSGFLHNAAVIGTDAATGAAMGSVFGPWGTAIGGVGGAGWGLYNQLTSHADGGPLNAPGAPGRDSALFWGAAGEHVWTHNEVQAAGGHGAMYAMRDAVLHRAGGGAIGNVDTTGMQVDTMAVAQTVAQMFPGVTIGGYRAPDGFNEHSSGEAADIMVGNNRDLGNQVASWALANAAMFGVEYVLWQQTQWNPDGSHSPMGDRGSPTQNHMDHVHIRTAGGGFMQGAGPGPAGAGSMPQGTSGRPAPAVMGGALGMAGGGMGGAGGMGMGGLGGGGFFEADPAKMDAANNRFARATERLTEAREREAEVLKKANAQQSEKDRAHDQVLDAERELTSAQQAQAEAQRGTFHSGRGGRGGSGGSMLATPLPGNFGVGGGLPGMAEWLVDWIGDMAMAPWAASLGMGGGDGLGAMGSDGAGMSSLAGFGGNMPSPTAAGVGSWSGAAMPAVFTGVPGSGGAFPSGSASPSGSPGSNAAPSSSSAASTTPSSGANFYKDWYPRAGDSPVAPPAPASNFYKDWYPAATDMYAGTNPFGIDLQNRYQSGNPNAAGPPSTGQIDPRLITPDHSWSNPPPVSFKPGGSSMQDMLNAAAQHGWSNQPTYGGLPGAPIFGDDAVHRSTGGPSGTDTIPAWLSPGEFTERKSAVDKYGPGFMQAVNDGRVDPASVHYYGVGGLAGVDDPETQATSAAAVPAPRPPTPPPTTPGPASPQGETPTGSGQKQDGTQSLPFNQGNSSPGLGISGGAGGQAAGMFPGGSLAFALAGRTIGYAGQAAAIGTEALMQTFLPDDTPLANFSNTIPGKLLGAVAGARPAGQNMAGKQTPQLSKDQVDQKSAAMSGGKGESPLIGEQHNYGVNNGDEVAQALSRAQYSSYNAGQGR
jgi:hypothetical protein